MNSLIETFQNIFISLKTVFNYKKKQINKQQNQQLYFIPLSQHQKYKQQIKPILQTISKGNLSNNQLISKLKQFQIYTEIYHNQRQTQYQQLIKTQQQLGPLFAKLAQYIINQQSEFNCKKIKLLLQNHNQSIYFNKYDILYLMSLMALNLIPKQQFNQLRNHNVNQNYQNIQKYNKKRKFSFPYDFADIFSDSQFKTKAIIAYFKQHFYNENLKHNNQTFTIKRAFLADKIQDIIQKHKNYPMKPYQLQSDKQSIQTFTGQGKVDFANKYIGGGALSSGCAQQQIMFTNHPQLLISVLFCQVMNDNQALLFNGFRKYSKNKGYGFDTKYAGQQKITQNFYKKNQYIVSIDAHCFPTRTDMKQLQKQIINRQLKKAYVGFSNIPQGINIVTSNWGCGVFKGDPRIKFMIQWLACSISNKKMIYCPSGHRSKFVQSKNILDEIQQRNVGEVYEALVKGCEKMKSVNDNIFMKMREQL